MDTLAKLPDIVDPTISEILDQTKDQLSAEQQYKEFGYEDYSPSIPQPKFSSTSGLSVAQLTLEGVPYSNENRTQGYDVQATVKKYTKAISYTEELYEWIIRGNKEKAMEFKEDVTAVQQSLYERVDTETAKLIYLAHTTTFQTGGDAVALAAYNHASTEPGVSVQRNIFKTTETHMPISYSALTVARDRMVRYYDLKGVQMRKPKNIELWIAQENYDAALRALNADKLPGTNYNDPNTLKNTITPRVVNWQPAGYSTYWALVDTTRVKRGVKMVWGWQPRFNQDSNYMNGSFYRTGSVYFTPCFRDWNWGFFSKGDGSAVAL